MKLKRLEIELQPSYAANPGQYVATLEYENQYGAVKMILDTSVSQNLLAFVGPLLAKCANRAAQDIANNILASVEEVRQLPEISVAAVPPGDTAEDEV